MKTKPLIDNKQIELLEKIARRSKMDCWFSVDEKGYIRDLEENNKVIATPKGVCQLINGMTVDDCKLSHDEVYALLQLFLYVFG